MIAIHLLKLDMFVGFLLLVLFVNFYFAAGMRAKYGDHRVCMSVCLSVCPLAYKYRLGICAPGAKSAILDCLVCSVACRCYVYFKD